MNWYNVRLIFCREVRDQLRDRRTLFMIAVLPLLLYPLLGMSLFQVAQFVREQPTRVLVLGTRPCPSSPLADRGDRFAERLSGEMEKLQLVELHFAADRLPPAPARTIRWPSSRNWPSNGANTMPWFSCPLTLPSGWPHFEKL